MKSILGDVSRDDLNALEARIDQKLATLEARIDGKLAAAPRYKVDKAGAGCLRLVFWVAVAMLAAAFVFALFGQASSSLF